MTKHYNKKIIQPIRRELRKKSTFGEKLLWIYLRRKQVCSERFLRQYSIDFYVVDFYCPRLHLAIESDGPIHFEDIKTIEYDKERQKYIEDYGIKFLRFLDEELKTNMDRVINSIEEKVKELQEANPFLPPLPTSRDLRLI
jgi:very-short-patch-repair endonuclease